MISIRKTGEGYYLVSSGNSHSVLKRVECTRLKHALTEVIKAHKEISVDIKGIRSIEQEGFRILEDLVRNAEKKKYRIRFINVDPQVSPAIKKLHEKKVELQDEFDQI
jgi:anti-anti-sigma regulatory factor